MKRLIVVVLLLGGCTTPQVTAGCKDAQEVLAAVQPYLSVAPLSIQSVATAIGIGAVVCGSPEYAAMRERLLAHFAQVSK